MELNPVLTLIYGLVFVACTVTIFTIQLVAYRLASNLEAEFEDGEAGKLLVTIVRRFLRWIVIAQAMASSIIVLYAVFPDSTLLRATLVIAAQIVTVVASVMLIVRVRALRRDPPANGSGEAVVELDAQAAAEVPPSTDHVGTPVDDLSDELLAVPSKLDESPAG